MKKLFILLFIIPLFGLSQPMRMLGKKAITASSWDIFTESFEGGYQNSWTESIGANTGCLVEENNADLTPPTGGGTKTIKLVKVITPTATGVASGATSYSMLAVEKPITYTDFYVQITANGLTTNGDMLYLLRLLDSSATNVVAIRLRNTSGFVKLFLATTVNGAEVSGWYPASGVNASINLNQWYHIQLKYDATNLLYSMLVDGNVAASGSLSGTVMTGVKRILVGDATVAKTLTAYFDLIRVSSTTF